MILDTSFCSKNNLKAPCLVSYTHHYHRLQSCYFCACPERAWSQWGSVENVELWDRMSLTAELSWIPLQGHQKGSCDRMLKNKFCESNMTVVYVVKRQVAKLLLGTEVQYKLKIFRIFVRWYWITIIERMTYLWSGLNLESVGGMNLDCSMSSSFSSIAKRVNP